MILLDLIGLLIVAGIIWAVVAYLRNRNVTKNSELHALRKQVQSAKVGLRNIAAGTSGNPVLDAQIALDDIFQLEDRQLNA